MNRRGFLGKCLGLMSAMLAPAAKLLDLPAAFVPEFEPEAKSPMYALVQATLRDLGKVKFIDISTELEGHAKMRSLLKKKRISMAHTTVDWKAP